MNIQKNLSLSRYTTFKIGGKASFFFFVKSLEELKEAVIFSKAQKLPFFVLGEGSNVLAPDKGFKGVIIKIEIPGIVFSLDKKSNKVLATVGAGENWDSFVQRAIKKKLYGIENLSGIPGSLGATPIQNVGAYGVEVGELIKELEAIDSRNLKVRKFSNSECNFTYRDSFFKTNEGKNFIVTKVTFALSKKKNLNTRYKDLREYLENKKINNPSLEDIRKGILYIRSKKFPDLKKFGTAGSFFKNPIIKESRYRELKKNYPEIPGFNTEKGFVKVSLAWILDKACNLKGFRAGNVGLFRNQPLVFVNFGKGNAKEIRRLKKKVEKRVFDKTKIKISPEVTILG